MLGFYFVKVDKANFEKLLPVVTFRGYFEDSLNKKFIINNPNFD